MKTENPDSVAAPAAPALDPEAARAALIEVLDQFNLTIEDFIRKSTLAYEQKVAANSLDDLKRLYFTLLQPGKSLPAARKECPAWPSGRFAGRVPDTHVLGPIKKRLLKAAAAAQSISQLEREKFRAREKDHLLRTEHLNLEREKFKHQLEAAKPSQPALPVSQETPDQMFERVYGHNPFIK